MFVITSCIVIGDMCHWRATQYMTERRFYPATICYTVECLILVSILVGDLGTFDVRGVSIWGVLFW